MMPGTFLYVYLGHVTGAVIGDSRERGIAEWLMLAVGLLATAAVTVRAYADRIESRLSSLFGPPRVKLQESYGGTESSASFDHAGLDEILGRHVDADGWVDDEAVREDEEALDRAIGSGESPTIDWLPYDWSINDRSNRVPR